MTDESTRHVLPRDERRAQILRTAAAAFASAGYSLTSMDDVAKSAGITKLIVYRHFESKAELYRTILEDVAQMLVSEWRVQVLVDSSVGVGIRTMLRVARAEPDSFRLLFVHSAREAEFAEFLGQFRALFLDIAMERLGSNATDVMMRDWAASMGVDFAVTAVLNWLDLGSADRDEEFLNFATKVQTAMVSSTIEHLS